jgi:glycosyltransferase involved in cell wall biosynthesis
LTADRPIRVAILTDNLGGGTGNHLLAMTRRWNKERCQAHVLSRAPLTARAAPEVPVRYLPSDGFPNVYPVAQIRGLRRTRAALQEMAPHLVHAYFFWSILFARLLKREGRVRVLIENREDQGFNWGFHEYAWLRMTRELPDRIICVSDAVKQVVMARENVDERRIEVIRNGVEPFEDSGAVAAETRGSLGLGPDHLVVGMVANFNRSVKGVSVLLDAVPEIVRAVPAARFLLLGRGEEAAALREKARRLGVAPYVLFAGYRRDIQRFYAVMDVSVLTSFSEGLSITLLESMCSGLPVVATRVGGNPEVVVDGETGFLVEPGDPAAFAARTIVLLKDRELRSRMGTTGRRRAESRFRLEDAASRYLETYEGVLGKG